MSDLRGIGMDLCEIGRMEKILTGEHRDAFLERVLTEGERAYVLSKGKMAASSLAAMWAAKEAVFKALGSGVTTSMKDVEVVHDDLGAPHIVLHGAALEAAPGSTMMISLTHEAGVAGAMCVWMQKE
ncbi:MAG: holo-ACP synthase [Clostridia bacterium]|nr:holo-ACP synthase [Clostridia bacterium]